jgi:hypothetical protein
MSNSLIEVLKSLDPMDDDHWTGDGLPRLDVLKSRFGGVVTRDEINESFPGFSRTKASEQVDPGNGEANLPVEGDTLEEVVLDKNGDGVVSELEQAQADTEAARKSMDEAAEILKAKNEALDKIVVKSAGNQKISQAENIKAFQASQNLQRAKAAKNAEMLNAFLKENQ